MDSSLYVCIIIDYFCGIFVGSDIFLASHLAISILISLAVGTHVVPKGDTLGPKPSLDFLYHNNFTRDLVYNVVEIFFGKLDHKGHKKSNLRFAFSYYSF